MRARGPFTDKGPPPSGPVSREVDGGPTRDECEGVNGRPGEGGR